VPSLRCTRQGHDRVLGERRAAITVAAHIDDLRNDVDVVEIDAGLRASSSGLSPATTRSPSTDEESTRLLENLGARESPSCVVAAEHQSTSPVDLTIRRCGVARPVLPVCWCGKHMCGASRLVSSRQMPASRAMTKAGIGV